MSKGPIQFLGSGVYDGVPFTFFQDHFGDDFDAYIMRQYTYLADWDYEDPAVLQRQLRKEARIDAKLERFKPLGQSLRDISSDGKVYLCR